MCDPVNWLSVRSLPALGDDIHLWRGRLEVDAPTHSRLQSCLSGDERQRAGHYRRAEDRRRYVAARGTLRCVLDGRPQDLRFRYAPGGKPALIRERPGAALDFNLSHAGDLVVLAVARSRRLGVDVERAGTEVDTEEIARRFFSPDEVRSLRGLPGGLRQDGFFRCWTRKEAYVKARGEGLQIALDSFDVTLDPASPARFTRGVDPSWQLLGFIAEPGYPAALVYDGAPAGVRFLAVDHMLAR